MSNVLLPSFGPGVNPGQAHTDAIKDLHRLLSPGVKPTTQEFQPEAAASNEPAIHNLGGQALHAANILRGKNDSFLPPETNLPEQPKV